MSNPSISINVDQFKSAARNLRQSIQGMGGDASHSQTLEALSHALFGKPYSEAMHTILLKQDGSQAPENASTSNASAEGGEPGDNAKAIVEAYNIVYDLGDAQEGDEDVGPLPEKIRMEFDLSDIKNDNGNLCSDLIEELVSDRISDETGFCHKGFEYDLTHIGSGIAKVCVLRYGINSVLVSDGKYVACDFPGTDQEYGYHRLLVWATDMANLMDTPVREVTLPEVLRDDYEVSDIMDLASQLGVTSNFDDPHGDFVNVTVRLIPPQDATVLGAPDRSVRKLHTLRVDLRHAPLNLVRAAALEWIDTNIALDNPELFSYVVTFKNGTPIPEQNHPMENRGFLLDRLVAHT